MTNNKIQMPANFVALNENEMSCVEGGGIVSQICYAFGRMFRSRFFHNDIPLLKLPKFAMQ